MLGIADLAFRLLPLGMKLKVGFEVFAETFNKFSDQIVRLSEDFDRSTTLNCPEFTRAVVISS